MKPDASHRIASLRAALAVPSPPRGGWFDASGAVLPTRDIKPKQSATHSTRAVRVAQTVVADIGDDSDDLPQRGQPLAAAIRLP